jgi:hypothetical protein
MTWPGLQEGGLTSGLDIVGEEGPELLFSRPGSRVTSNEDSMNMLMSAMNGTQELHIYIDGKEIPHTVIKHGAKNADFVRGIRSIAGVR